MEAKEEQPPLEWATEGFEIQSRTIWPESGKHILAQFDEDSVVVYQAFQPEIASFAAQYNAFCRIVDKAGTREYCPLYNPHRMTWIKTNFLWMMFRSQWATSPNQERILAIWLKREAFDGYLERALTKGKPNDMRGTVRLQWDPDHFPNGSPHPSRRAVQLGLRGVETFSNGDDILWIEDITEFVREQRLHVEKEGNVPQPNLIVARERVYVPESREACDAVGLDNVESDQHEE